MSPYEFVACANAHRRHDDYNERALAAGRLKIALQEETDAAPKSQKTSENQKPPRVAAPRKREDGNSRVIAAKRMNVGKMAVDMGAKIIEQGSAELQEAVAAGDVSVTAAAKVLDLPKSEQAAAAKNGHPKGDGRVWDRFEEASITPKFDTFLIP